MKKFILSFLSTVVLLFGDTTYNISGGTQNFITNNNYNHKEEDFENLYLRLGLAANSFEESFMTMPFSIQLFSDSMRPFSLGIGYTTTVAMSSNEVALDENGVPLDTMRFYITNELEILTTLAGKSDGFSLNIGYIYGMLQQEVQDDRDYTSYVAYTKYFNGFGIYLNTPHLLKWGAGVNLFYKSLYNESGVWTSTGLQIIW